MIGHFYELQNNFFLDSMFEMIQQEGIKRNMWTAETYQNHLFKDYDSLLNKIKNEKSISNSRFAIFISFYEKIEPPREDTLIGNTSFMLSEINLVFSVYSTKMNAVTLKTQDRSSIIFGTNDLYLFINHVISSFNQDSYISQTASMKSLYFNIDNFIAQKEIKKADGSLIDSWDFVEFQKEIFSNNDAIPGDYNEFEANTLHKIDFSVSFDKVRRKDVFGIFQDQNYQIVEFFPNSATNQDIPVVNSTQPKYVHHP